MVAEGGEDEAELELLQGLGVTWAQGYHLGKPAPAGQWIAGYPEASRASTSAVNVSCLPTASITASKEEKSTSSIVCARHVRMLQPAQASLPLEGRPGGERQQHGLRRRLHTERVKDQLLRTNSSTSTLT